MWKMLLRLYEKWIPCTGNRFVQHCIALNLYHGVPWCWLQHIIYVVSTLIKVFVINCGVLCSSINYRVAPYLITLFWVFVFLVVCTSLNCRAVCWFRSAMCKNVRTAPTWRAAESGRNSVLLKSTDLTHPNFLAGQKLNLHNSMSPTLDLHQKQHQ